eukprot:2951984-Pyramimonas_sp.AAC.1
MKDAAEDEDGHVDIDGAGHDEMDQLMEDWWMAAPLAVDGAPAHMPPPPPPAPVAHGLRGPASHRSSSS